MRALILLLVLLSGCAYTYPLDTSGPEERRSLSERAARQRTLIAVQGETPVPVTALQIGADSTTWIDPATGTPRSVGTADLVLVRFPSSERSPLQTFLTGLVGGAVVGGVIGAIAYADSGPSILVSSQTESALLFGMLFGSIGGTGGGLVALDALNPIRLVPTDLPAQRDTLLTTTAPSPTRR